MHYVSKQQKIRNASACTVQSGYLNRLSSTAPFVLFASSATAFILSMKWAPLFLYRPGFFSRRIFRGKWSAYAWQNPRLSHRKTLMWQQAKNETHAHTNMINVFNFFSFRWEMNRSRCLATTALRFGFESVLANYCARTVCNIFCVGAYDR